MGIVATIPEGVPRERFERISYAYSGEVKIEDYLAGHSDAGRKAIEESDLPQLKSEIVRLLEVTPTYYLAVVEAFSDFEFSTVVNALGELHEEGKLWQDDTGRICLRNSKFASSEERRVGKECVRTCRSR